MKFLLRKFLAITVTLFVAFSAKATNDTLTIGQAFDWSVGDTLSYVEFTYVDYGAPQYNRQYFYGPVHSIVVISRSDFIDSTIYITKNENDSIFTTTITHIDSFPISFDYKSIYPITLGCGSLQVVPNCDSPLVVYCNTYVHNYNGHFFDSLLPTIVSFGGNEWGWFITYIKGIGIEESVYTSKESGNCGIKLVYYKSDSIAWIDSAFYFPTNISETTKPTSFHILPNPATDEITLTTETDAPADIFIYDITGNCLRTITKQSAFPVTINTTDLPAGYYLLKLKHNTSSSATDNGVAYSKGFIIAR